eukprot:2052228-Pleurochrysis_carterae.AAC.2
MAPCRARLGEKQAAVPMLPAFPAFPALAALAAASGAARSSQSRRPTRRHDLSSVSDRRRVGGLPRYAEPLNFTYENHGCNHGEELGNKIFGAKRLLEFLGGVEVAEEM